MKLTLTTTITAAVLTARASACDLCACELPLMRLENRAGWHLGVSEQFTSYESLRRDGAGIGDSAGQYHHSSITQIFVGYDFTKEFGVQVNVPLIYRSFRRVEEARIESGNESGLGDMSLLAHWSPLRIERGDFLLTGRIVAGVKFPTGDSGRLAEEGAHGHGHEEEHHEEEEHEHEEELPPSGVHGHDLALGSGSVDGVFGADAHLQWKRLFLNASVQVTVRGEGDHDYDYADDVQWRTGLSAVVWEGDGLNVALEARLSGETKGEDDFRGARLDDTASAVVYLGPHVLATWRDRLSVNAGFDFPISRENSGVQIAPDLRFQAAIGWQF